MVRDKTGDKAAQVSMEFLIIAGFAFLMIMPLIIIFYTSQQDLNEKVTISQSDKIVSQIVNAADEVYYSGYPAKKTFKIYMPGEVTSVVLGNNYLEFKMGSRNTVARYSVANLTGSMAAYGGMHIIEVSALQTGIISISDGT